MLDHQLHEVTILSLPGSIPDALTIDVSWMHTGDTFLLNRISPPEGVQIVSDHADEIAVVTLVASRGSVARARAEGEEAEADADAAGEDA